MDESYSDSDTSSELSEALFNINVEDSYFGYAFQTDFLKSDSLNWGKIGRSDVGYGTYLLHYILGSILTLPHCDIWGKRLNIEKIFFKLEYIDSKAPNIIKVFFTFKTQKKLHYKLFDFSENSLFHDIQKIIKQDLDEISPKLSQKGISLKEYPLSSGKHTKIFKPSSSSGPYQVIEKWRNEGSDIAIVDPIIAIPSEKSPIVAEEVQIPIENWKSYVSKNSDVSTSKYIDITDHLPGNNEKLAFPQFGEDAASFSMKLTEMFEKLATIYRTFDTEYDLKLSSSRIDHCGFIHGALSMNLKNNAKLSVHVENGDLNYHDTIKMVITSNSADTLERATQKPIIVDFRDVDTTRAIVKATEFIKRKGVVELPPYVQTLAAECFYTAVCLTSRDNAASVIKVKIVPKPSSISKLMAETAEKLFDHYLNMKQDKSGYENQMKLFEDQLQKTFDTVQSREKLTNSENIRCLSRYIIGEAGSYTGNAKIYLRQDLPFELDPETDDLRQRLTTFVIETQNPSLDLVVNFFENPTRHSVVSIYDANMHTRLSETRPTVTHTITVNVVSWLNEVGISNDLNVKSFFERKIHVEPVTKISTDSRIVVEKIKRLPSIDLPTLVSYIDDQVSVASSEGSRYVAPFFEESQKLIENPNEFVSVIRGIFGSQRVIHENVKATTSGIVGCHVIHFKEKDYQTISEEGLSRIKNLRVFSFSYLNEPLSGTKGSGIFSNLPEKLAKYRKVSTRAYNVIFSKNGRQANNNVVIAIADHKPNLPNLKQEVKKCVRFQPGTKFKRNDMCNIPQEDETENLIDPERKLVKTSTFQLRLKTVQKISMITAHGMIIKDMIADLVKGDYKGLCFNMGFISGGFLASHVADKALELGIKVASAGQNFLGQALRVSSPFIRRATSGLIVYDLVNSIRRYRNNDTEAMVDIAEDSVFLSIDTVDVGIEVAEALELVSEGLSATTGPIGLGIAAVTMIGGEIYKSVREIHRLDHIYHLSGWEKFKIGMRTFFHANVESTINEIRESRFDPLETVFRMYQRILLKNPDVKMYVGPTLTNRSSQTFIEFEPNNRIYLNGTETRNDWLELSLKIDHYSSTCRPNGRAQKKTAIFFVCSNSIGVESGFGNGDRKKSILINLGDGTDVAYGMHDHDNVFIVGNGQKIIYGGNYTNTFILNGHITRGSIRGIGRQNALDFSKFNLNEPVSYSMTKNWLRHSTSSVLHINNIHIVKGRANMADGLVANANLSKVDLQGGIARQYDSILIEDSAAAYNLTMNVASYTKIHNNAHDGDFVYIYQSDSTNNIVRIENNSSKASHLFIFDFEYSHISNIYNTFTKNIRKVGFKLMDGTDEKKVWVEGHLKKCVFQFKNSFFIYSPDGKNFIGNFMTKNDTHLIVDEFSKTVLHWEIPLIVHNLQDNSTIVFGKSSHNESAIILDNDPEHSTHMIGGSEENTYKISTNFNTQSLNCRTVTKHAIVSDIFIHKSKYDWSFRHVVDLRALYSRLDMAEISLHINDDFIVHANIESLVANEKCALCRIFFKNFSMESLKSQIVFLGNVPMKIRELNSKFSLLAVPLKFNKNETKIILTHNDIGYNQRVYIERFLGEYSIFYSNETDLVITDKFSRLIDDEFSSIIILKEFYGFYRKMSTLVIEFSNLRIEFKDEKRFKRANFISLESLSSDIWL